MPTPSVLVLRAPGTNCDGETVYAFELAGARTDRVHINQVRESPQSLKNYQILVIPGGFSYGDDVSAGRILASQLQHFLSDAVRTFRDHEKLVLGICNGFQILLKAGLLVPPDEDGPLAPLTANETGRFEDRWVHLAVSSERCPFLKEIRSLRLPVAHGEGRFLTRKDWILKGLGQAGQIAMRYVDPSGQVAGYPHNPNGSQDNVAGLCDPTGRVLGLMPHPERHILPTQYPSWTREGLMTEGDGLAIFRNAVEFFKS